MWNLDRKPKLIYALCGCPSREPPPVSSIGSPDGVVILASCVGLPFGVGNPTLAGLHSEHWAVVRVDDTGEPIPIFGADGRIAAIEFKQGQIIFCGDRLKALERLIELGADKNELAIRYLTGNDHRLADAGDYGVATAAKFARAGAYGLAIGGSLAIAGRHGQSTVASMEGLAVVDAYGTACGDTEAIAVGGLGSTMTTGDGGLAFARDACPYQMVVGEQGNAIARRPYYVRAGAQSLIVVLEAEEGYTRINAGKGTLAILRFASRNGDDGWYHVIAVAGEGRLVADQECIVIDREFVPATSPRDVAGVLDFAATKGLDGEQRTDETPPKLATKAGMNAQHANSVPRCPPELSNALQAAMAEARRSGKSIVLCPRAPYPEWRIEPGTSPPLDWPPDTPWPTHFVGLLDGIGDFNLADLGKGFGGWTLLLVDDYIAIPPFDDNGYPAAVTFQYGTPVGTGSRTEILTALIDAGVSPYHLASRISMAPHGGCVTVNAHDIAIAGDDGWAFAGCEGEATAGAQGIAFAGVDGTANAGYRGIAVADELGSAIAGDCGIAISEWKRYGEAKVGDYGLAYGRGRFKFIHCGDWGAAIGDYSLVHAGNHGVAIGNGDIEAGTNGFVVSRRYLMDFAFSESGPSLSDSMYGSVAGGVGCLLIDVTFNSSGRTNVVSGIVGSDGLEPSVRYRVRGGAFRAVTTNGATPDGDG